MEWVVERVIGGGEVVTERSAAVMRMFGVDMDRLRKGVEHKCSVNLGAGMICYITGASGAGKSVLLREFYEQADESKRLDLNKIELAGDRTVVDCLEKPLAEAMKILSIVGLSDVFAMVNVPARLSEGQGYRFRLAMAMASGKEIIFGDEFCSNLDRVTAAVIAFGVRKFARKYGVTFVLASSHDDLVGDLEPDVLVVRKLDGSAEVVERSA